MKPRGLKYYWIKPVAGCGLGREWVVARCNHDSAHFQWEFIGLESSYDDDFISVVGPEIEMKED